MAEKITTEACVLAIAAAWPVEYGKGAENWKRISKKGAKGQPIERVFNHRTLPLTATVTETSGTISATTIKGIAPWDVDYDSEAGEAIMEMFDTEEAREFCQNNAVFPASDFYFYVSDEADSGYYWYVITPKAYFDRDGYQYDQELSFLLEKFLPEGDGEASEGSFTTERSPEETRAELLQRGFAQSDKFDAFMKR